MRTLRIRVSGTVQGVGYRYFAKRVADRQGVKGWVRNLHDGGVEVVAQFPDDETEDLFIKALQQGPLYSSVSAVDFDIEEHPRQFNSFEITF